MRKVANRSSRLFALLSMIAVASAAACTAGSSASNDGGSGVTPDADLSDQRLSEATSPQPEGSIAADGGESGIPVKASVDAGMDGGACPQGIQQCNAPTVCGPPVLAKEIVGAAPAALGGSVFPGIYFLTALNVYRSQAGGATPSYQVTFDLGTTTFTEASYQGGAQQSPTAGTYSTSGTTLTRTITCPAGTGTETSPYTSTSSTLILYRTLPDGTYELTFSRQ